MLHIDIETRSSVDLKKSGVYPYAEAPDFSILLFGVAEDNGPVKVYDLACGEKLPTNILDALLDETILKYAHNASFERVCLSRYLWDLGRLPRGQYLSAASWRCTMIWAAYCGLPLSLESLGSEMHLDKKKLTEGKELIRFFCVPCKPSKANILQKWNLPTDDKDKWDRFKAYNIRDVEAEMEIARRLSAVPIPDIVWHEYKESEEINDRGIAIDTELVASAIKLDGISQQNLFSEMKDITEIENPRSVSQLKTWLKQNGLDVESLGKKEIQSLLPNAPSSLQPILSLRLEAAKSSIKKYTAMQNALCTDNRVRGMFQFYGAVRSGRFSGRIVQLQNLYRNSLPDLDSARALVKTGDYESIEMLYGSVPDTLSECIRTSFIPSPGNHFVVSDFSAIEARVLAWMAHEHWRLGVFENGGDIYCASASKMFRVPVEKHGVNGHLRQKGKIAELALGYGGSVGALIAMGALEMGVKEDELKPLVDAWRIANPNIVQFWWEVDKAAKSVIKGRSFAQVSCLKFSYHNGCLFIMLPSGRPICYVHPQIGINRFGGESITFLGMDTNRRMGKIETYGPKLVENCIAGGTLVITDQGSVPIEKITRDMLLWDGEKYVAHDGIVEKGMQDTICVDGLRMTPDHYILSSAGWVQAAKSPSLHWMDFQNTPDRHRIRVDYSIERRPVYDILNAGPDHRFALWDRDRACIVSNCTQAISRDILCYAMHNLRQYGIVAHVHDEVICDVPKSVSVEEITSIMSQVPPWTPGLCLRGDGYAVPYYQKDN